VLSCVIGGMRLRILKGAGLGMGQAIFKL